MKFFLFIYFFDRVYKYISVFCYIYELVVIFDVLFLDNYSKFFIFYGIRLG